MARVRKHRQKWQVLYRDPTGRERSAGVYALKNAADRVKRSIETDLDRGEWFDPAPGRTQLLECSLLSGCRAEWT